MLLFINFSQLFQTSIAPLLTGQTPVTRNNSSSGNNPTATPRADSFTQAPTNPRIAILINSLNNTNTQELIAAIIELGDIGQNTSDQSIKEQITTALIPLFRNSGDGIKTFLAHALGQIGQNASPETRRQITETLMPLLRSDNYLLRRAGASAIGNMGGDSSPEVMTALIGLLSDSEYSVIRSAIRALGNLGHDSSHIAALAPLLSNDISSGIRTSAREALDRILNNSSDQVGLLTPLLQSNNPSVLIFAVNELTKREEDIPPDTRNQIIRTLIPLLTGNNNTLKIQAIEALGNIGHDSPLAVAALIELQNNLGVNSDIRSDIRDVARQALRTILRNSQDPSGLLIPLLTHRNPIIRREAAFQLAFKGRGSSAAITALIRVTQNDSDNIVIAAASRTLGKIGNNSPEVVPEVVNALNCLLNHRDTFVKINAAQVLVDLRQNSPAIINTLTTILGNNDLGSARVFAAHTLSRIRGEIPQAAKSQAITVLNSFLNDNDEFVKLQAAEALVNFGQTTPSVMRTLTSLLRSNDSFTKRSAAEILGNIRENAPQAVKDEAITALTSLLNDRENPSTREIAIESIGRLGRGSSRAANLLVPLLGSRDLFTRSLAARTLGSMGVRAPEITRALLPLVGDAEESVGIAAAEALVQIGGQGGEEEIRTLIGALNAPNQNIQTAAATALVNIGRPAVPQIIQQFGNMSSLTVSSLLSRIGEGAIPDLIETLNHENPLVRANAAGVLGQIINNGARVNPETLNRIITEITNIASSNIGNNSGERRDIKIAAIQTLGLIGSRVRTNETAMNFLNRVANDQTNPVLRAAASDALRRINQE